jgi:hypothetical protein
MKMSVGKLSLLSAVVCLLLSTVVDAFKCVHQEREHWRNLHKRSSPDIVDDEISSTSSSEAVSASIEVLPEDDDFEKARIEYIKQQILHKLGMSRAPSVQKKPLDFAECKFFLLFSILFV